MFAILNRWRGTEAIVAKFIGALLAIVLYVVTGSYIVALAVGIGYIAGESSGWGKWIGGIMSNNKGTPTAAQLDDREGEKNGIHWLANLITPELKNYYNYCVTALTLRGSYWAALTLLPLVLTGYIGIELFTAILIGLGIAFPLSVVAGKWSMVKFTIDWKYFKMNGTWEHAEVWNGLAQSIAMLAILLSTTQAV